MFAAENCQRLRVQGAARRFVGRGMLAGSLLFMIPAARAADPAGGLGEKPFAARPAPRGPTIFTQLPPEDTGVRTENRYADPRMWGDLYQEF